MNDLAVMDKSADWRRLKALVLDSVSSPITKRVYNLGLDEFFAWYSQEPRPGFTKATVAAWRVALEARGLGAVSINVRITAVRKLAVEAADNGLLAPELANGITRVKGVSSKGVRLGNWLTARQAQTLLNAPDATTPKGLRDRAIVAVLLGCGLRRSEVAALTFKHSSRGERPVLVWHLSSPPEALELLSFMDCEGRSDKEEQRHQDGCDAEYAHVHCKRPEPGYIETVSLKKREIEKQRHQNNRDPAPVGWCRRVARGTSV